VDQREGTSTAAGNPPSALLDWSAEHDGSGRHYIALPPTKVVRKPALDWQHRLLQRIETLDAALSSDVSRRLPQHLRELLRRNADPLYLDRFASSAQEWKDQTLGSLNELPAVRAASGVAMTAARTASAALLATRLSVARLYALLRQYALERREKKAEVEAKRQRLHEQATELNFAGLDRYRSGEYAAARELYQQAIELWHRLGDRGGEAVTLNNLGIVEFCGGNHITARDLYLQALLLWRNLGDSSGERQALGNLASVEHATGNYGMARRLYMGVLAACREVGDLRGEGQSLGNLAAIEVERENLAAAVELYASALAVWQSVGSPVQEAEVLSRIGCVAQLRGDWRTALQRFAAALRIYTSLELPSGMALLSAMAGAALLKLDMLHEGRLSLLCGQHHLREHEVALAADEARVLARARTSLPGGEDIQADARAMALDELALFVLETAEAALKPG
jgi:tetratricopeptide (TPR) repeat protein